MYSLCSWWKFSYTSARSDTINMAIFWRTWLLSLRHKSNHRSSHYQATLLQRPGFDIKTSCIQKSDAVSHRKKTKNRATKWATKFFLEVLKCVNWMTSPRKKWVTTACGFDDVSSLWFQSELCFTFWLSGLTSRMLRAIWVLPTTLGKRNAPIHRIHGTDTYIYLYLIEIYGRCR